MIKKIVIIVNKFGIHARPCTKITKTAAEFKSQISIRKGNQVADAKSIMSMLLLAIDCGQQVEVTANGEDEKEAIEIISSLLTSHFDYLT